MSLIVHLTDLQDQSANEAELTYTDNISAHGACVISKRAWKPGEVIGVTSFKDKISLRGKVVHCQKRSDGRYAVGLVFEAGGIA